MRHQRWGQKGDHQGIEGLKPGQRKEPAADDMTVDASIGPQRNGASILLIGAAKDDDYRHDAEEQQDASSSSGSSAP